MATKAKKSKKRKSPTETKDSKDVTYKSPTPFNPPVFDLEKDDKQAQELKNYFDENGYAVIQIGEIKGLEEKFWSWMQSLGTGLPQTFPPQKEKNLKSYRGQILGNLGNGIFNGKERCGGKDKKQEVLRTGIGQSEFVWTVRDNLKIRSIFQLLLNTNDLRVSFDSANIFLANIHHQTNYWWHVDQQDSKSLSVQGLYNLKKCDESSGGFLCYPKSQKYHAEIMARRKPKKNQNFIVLRPDKEPLLTTMDPILVCAPPFTFTIWDSRTIHCNTTGKKWNAWPSSTNPVHRLVAYVSMCEAERCKEVDEKRVQMYLQGGTTNHTPEIMKEKTAPRWPRKGFEMNLKQNHPACSPVSLNRNQLSLLADEKYWYLIPSHLKLLNNDNM